MKSEFSQYNDEIGKEISFVKVNFARDKQLLHQWMQKAHVIPFWKLEMPLKQYEQHLQKMLADRHQTLYLGLLDGVPMSYWEAYWVKGDILEKHYTYSSKDQGIHLLIGEEAFLGKGCALPLLRAMVEFQFQEMDTEKVVAEPDIRNDKMIYVFEKCGFQKVKPIQLPEKTAMLMFCQRETFERRWNDAFKATTGKSI